MTQTEYNRFLDPGFVPQTFREVELQREAYAASVAIDRRQLYSIRTYAERDDFIDQANDMLIKTLRMNIYGIGHPDRHVVRFPATWWDAVKERFAPAWFLDRWPAMFTEVTASLTETYPDIQPSLPDISPVMRFMVSQSASTYVW